MIFIEPILETPIYLHSYSSEKVNQKFPSKATVAKQPSSEVLQHCSSILRVPPTGFKINTNNILPGYSKWGGREGDSLLTFRGQMLKADSMRIWLVGITWLFYKKRIRPGTTGFLFTKAKDSSVLRKTTEGLMRCWPNLNDMVSRWIWKRI